MVWSSLNVSTTNHSHTPHDTLAMLTLLPVSHPLAFFSTPIGPVCFASAHVDSPWYLSLSLLICHRLILCQWRILLDLRSLMHAGAPQSYKPHIFHHSNLGHFVSHITTIPPVIIDPLYHYPSSHTDSQIIFICMYRRSFSCRIFEFATLFSSSLVCCLYNT